MCSLKAVRKVLGRHILDEVQGLEDDFKSTQKPAVVRYEALEGLLEIDLWIPTRKEEVGLLLRFLCSPTRTLPDNPTRTPTL